MKKSSAADLPIPQRIRNRRESLGLAAYELARKAGISGSYLSLIESGAKVPSEEIAVRIAGALDDDPELYLAWVHASPYGDLRAHLDRLERLEQLRSTPGLRGRLRRGENLEPQDDANALGNEGDEGEPARRDVLTRRSAAAATRLERASGRLRRWMRRAPAEQPEPRLSTDAGADPSLAERDVETNGVEAALADAAFLSASVVREDAATIAVPLLADGADPGDDPEEAEGVIDTLRLDPRLLPPRVERPFAYRPGPDAVERVGGSIRPGDVVVLTSRPGPVESGVVYAVRHEGRVVLSRLVRHDKVLLLLPSEQGGRPVPIESRDERALRERLAGAVVTTIRSWGVETRPEPPPPAPALRGRSVKLEEGFLVRDCEWKENYGWRPIQRAEDMDYLEAHPGTRIRYRLIKDGRVRYLLEMTAEQWREALGSYFDGPTWRRNGYIVAVTRRRRGRYTTEFQDRWAPYVRPAPGRDA